MIHGATTRNGHTALHLAANSRASSVAAEMTEALLGSNHFPTDAVNAVDSSGRTALHIMVEREHREAAQFLLQSRRFSSAAARNSRKETALDMAKSQGDVRMISLLTRLG